MRPSGRRRVDIAKSCKKKAQSSPTSRATGGEFDFVSLSVTSRSGRAEVVAEDGLEAIAAAAGLAAAKRCRADDLRDLRLGELQLDALEQRDRVEIVLPRTSVVNGICIQSIVFTDDRKRTMLPPRWCSAPV